MTTTVAQARRTNPAFDRMYRDAEKVRRAWPSAHTVAHLDVDTGVVSFWLTVRQPDAAKAQRLLGGGFRPVDGGHQFHGSRADMDRLLAGLELAR